MRYHFRSSLTLLALFTITCGGLYPLALYGIGKLMPAQAKGSLISDETGAVVGSTLIAQNFTKPGYFWPRPSATNYDAASSGATNLSIAGKTYQAQITERLKRYPSDSQTPLELVTTSASGLDPHLTVNAARQQAMRVTKARGLKMEDINALIGQAEITQPFGPPLVNVLRLNLSLDTFCQQERIKCRQP